MDTATKTGIDATKAASKGVVQKTAEVTGHLIGNKIADKITSVDGSTYIVLHFTDHCIRISPVLLS